MNIENKELYMQPALVKHEVLRDITATRSGNNHPDISNIGALLRRLFNSAHD